MYNAIKVSTKSMRLLFEGCSIEYILTECYGRCCESKNGIGVVILPREEEAITRAGGMINDNLLQPNNKGICPFKRDYLCSLHNKDIKPLACILSPFAINSNNTLIIKNRNKLFRCFRDKRVATRPAYLAYKTTLVRLFGAVGTERLIKHLDSNRIEDIYMHVSADNYKDLLFVKDKHKSLRQKPVMEEAK